MTHFKGKIKVGVMRGGPSGEYDVSLNTGANVLKALKLFPDKYEAKDIFIDKKGVWHVDGIAKSPDSIVKHFDVIFNALHGDYGEDGKVQKLLDDLGVPYTGSGSLASAHAMNKDLAKKTFKKHGITVAHHQVIRRDEKTDSRLFGVFAHLKKPLVVKPNTGGSSLGATVGVKTWEEFVAAVNIAFEFSDSVIVEEFIAGREATCGVVDSATHRGESYALPPIEIIKPAENEFFDYDAKYSGKTQEICPGNFTPEETAMIQDFAMRVHKALDLKHYSRTDFIVAPDGIYALEVNTLPGLTSESLLPKSLKATGCEYHDFLDHLISLAIDGR